MTLEEQINNLYNIHKESDIYNDSFENSIFKLVNAYDNLFLSEMRKSLKNSRLGIKEFDLSNNKDYDAYRHAYRAMVKFIYEDNKHGPFSSKISAKDIYNYQKELEETIQFNYIRNNVDKYNLNKYKAELINDELVFTPKNDNRSLVYDLYARKLTDYIPESKNDKDTKDILNINNLIVELSLKKQEFESKKIFKPSNDKLDDLTKKLLLFYKNKYGNRLALTRFNEYFVDEYLLVYAFIAALAIYKNAYILSIKSSIDETINTPSVLYPKDRFVNDLCQVTGLTKDIAESVIKDMVYAYDLHQDRLTIYQPIFDLGDYYLISNQLTLLAYPIDKLIKLHDIKRTNEVELTRVHKYLSDLMNDNMDSYLSETYENLVGIKNCRLLVNEKPVSEVDLVLVDIDNKKICLIEQKRYMPVDNEKDAANKDKHINVAIKQRLKKDKLVIDNFEEFLKQNGVNEESINIVKDYDISSLLVTNSYSGGVSIKEDIPVVDEGLFYFLLKENNGDLNKTYEYIKSKEFFKLLEKEIVNKKENEEYCYKGIKARVNIK